jgi:ABC-type transport system involved in multi-copper enzyme maturation permease subunit
VRALLSVIRAECFKVVRKRRVYVLAGLLWLVLPGLVLLIGRILDVNVRGSFVDEAEVVANVVQQLASPFGIARAALVAPALLSPTFYIIAIALLAGLLIGEERSNRMWKSVLTTQPLRLPVLAGKLTVAMLVLGLLLAGGFLFGVLFGSAGMLFLDTHAGGDWWGLARLYLLQWLFAAAATLFAFLMIFLTRNVSLGMVLVFFLPPLSEGLYAIYRATVRVQPLTRLNALFQALDLRATLEALPRYFFSANLYAPARQPLAELVGLFGAGPGDDLGPLTSLLRSDTTLLHSGLVMLGYGAIFLALLVWLFLRRDVD